MSYGNTKIGTDLLSNAKSVYILSVLFTVIDAAGIGVGCGMQSPTQGSMEKKDRERKTERESERVNMSDQGVCPD